MFSPFKTLAQPEQGFRYGIDSFLLARFAKFRKTDHVCDLGAGVGILGLLALNRHSVRRVTAVEIQEELLVHLKKNVETLGLGDRVEILGMDWRDLAKKSKPPKFDVVLSNPPYRKLQTGKLSPHASKSAAKHEIHGALKDLVAAGKKILKPEGKFYLMYPPLRLEEVIIELNSQRLKLQRMAMIHPFWDRSATQVLLEIVRSPVRELRIDPPIVVYLDPDHYQPDIEAWVGPKRRR